MEVATLPVDCLVRVLNALAPFPDRFRAAGACKRWRAASKDPRLFVRVRGDDGAGAEDCGGAADLERVPREARDADEAEQRRESKVWGEEYASVGEAVAATRPGDTLLIGRGTFDCSEVVVPHPLTIVGAGEHETCLRAPRKALCALRFKASSRMSCLAVEAQVTSCIDHIRGRLNIHTCSFRLLPHPLSFLSAAITSGAAWPSGGVLNVSECRIAGAAAAIRCAHAAERPPVTDTRVILCGGAAIWWFDLGLKRKHARLPSTTARALDDPPPPLSLSGGGAPADAEHRRRPSKRPRFDLCE
mmetsp:Transcript_25499/g.83959  ORF Transcript_25499/g.83959 Transcript_25499/m.83959 type:complete len:302 (+) Transcript_25499:100-1005(+)